AAWEDTVEAKEPRQEKGRAFVSVANVLTFSGGKSFTVNFVEGYLVNRDGTAGSRYFDLQGHTVVETSLGKDSWSFETPVSTQDLQMMGFNPKEVLFSKHVTVKTVTREGPFDTEWVSRVTTIQWKKATGQSPVKQFVSLQGYHRRVK